MQEGPTMASDRRFSRRIVLAGLTGLGALTALGCGLPGAPRADAPKPTEKPAEKPAAAAPTQAAAATPATGAGPTAAAAQPTAAQPSAAATKPAAAPAGQAAGAAPKSGEIILTPEQQYGVGSGLEDVARLYAKENPGVRIQVDVKPQQGYSDWGRAQMAGGTKSGLMTASFLQDLLSADKFVDLRPYLDRESPYTKKKWIESFLPETFQPDSPSGAIQQLNLMRTNVVWFYNRDLFKKAGLDPDKTPTKFSELIATAETLKKAGIQPFSIEGDYDGFWRMNIGWWRRLFLDSYLRDTIKITRSQKGDYNYRPAVDDKWEYNPNDPLNDGFSKVSNNSNRVVGAIVDKKVVVDGDLFRDAYGHIKKLTEYGDPNYFALSREQARQAFITGKAAMWSDQPVFFPVYEKIVGAPSSSIKRFDYGVFPYVDIDDSKLTQGKQRTFVGNLGFWAIPKKDPKQNDLELDFFQFLTNPPVAKEFMLAGLTKTGGDLVGPMPVIGVEMPAEWKQRFDQMKDIGPAGPNTGNYGGALLSEQQAAREYVDLTQRWFTGKIGEAEYFKALQKSFDDTVPRLVKDQGINLDKPELQPKPRS
jgi:ABC-type glycerol-3-phosphate transport system substrate-binding protein